MRISDWSSDVCSSDLRVETRHEIGKPGKEALAQHPRRAEQIPPDARRDAPAGQPVLFEQRLHPLDALRPETRGDEQHHQRLGAPTLESAPVRSEEHTSELKSLMRISYAVFCLKKKNNTN